VLALGEPILARLGWPATIFAATDFTGTERPMAWPGVDRWLGSEFEPELVPLGWDELGELAGRGWEVGSHTCSHPRLTRTGDEQLASELERSRAALEEALGRPCRSVAYPYGDVDARVIAAAADAGYGYGAALPVGSFRPPEPLDWPRAGIYNRDGLVRFRLKVSPLVRRVRGRR
jgi:peptidoglycan/xylan/chitin deacetylase (PgdA/CDA1 family)